jgi:hypothetical protein
LNCQTKILKITSTGQIACLFEQHQTQTNKQRYNFTFTKKHHGATI